MLAPTGAGKNHFLQAPRKLLRSINLFDCIGPDESMSQTAIQGHVARNPLSLCPMDEIGVFLERVQGKRAASFETGVSKTPRSLWGLDHGETNTAGYAQRKAETLYATAMTILSRIDSGGILERARRRRHRQRLTQSLSDVHAR